MSSKRESKKLSNKPKKSSRTKSKKDSSKTKLLGKKLSGGSDIYHPICIKLPDTNSTILDNKANVEFSTNIDYPRLEYGFIHFIHATKIKMEIVNQFEGKKKIYLVLNPFERYVEEYNNSIGANSIEYFELKNKPNILSRGFYKLWEIFMMMDIIDPSKEKFVSAHLAEGPGSFIQATMFYRDMMCKKGVSKNDKYHAITLHPDNNKHVPPLEKEFVDYYGKEKPTRFILHKTYSKQVAGGSDNKHNGDITNPKTIKLFGGAMDEKADLVTADGGFDWENENTQEQESFRLLFGQIVGASQVQKKGGVFVCKFFETFSKTSLKFIMILKQLYKEVYLIKPLMSRPSNSEKYAVCVDFKYDEKNKEFKDISKKLLGMLDEMHKNNDKNVVDIFESYDIPDDIINHMVYINMKIANEQFKSINEIITFIENQNFHGEAFESGREKQIEATKFWLETFFPEPSKIKQSKEKASDLLERQLKKSNEEISK